MAYSESIIEINTFHCLSLIIFMKIWVKYCYYFHFTYEATESKIK